jgi:hypothetical protein
LYVLELPHPSGLAGAKKTKDRWTMTDEGGALDVEWLEDDEPLDAATSTVRCKVRMLYRGTSGKTLLVEDDGLQRGFTLPQLERLVGASAQFAIEGVFGELDESVTLDAPSAWRMVAVLGMLQ